MKCHEVDYEILDDDMQMVEVELDPGETVVAEAGAMNYMEDGIDFETKMGDGSEPEKSLFGKLLDAGTRTLTGESIFLTHFTNRGSGKKKTAFAAPYPGRIVPLDMAKVGGEILYQKEAFLCAALGTNVGIAFNKRLGAGFFGGEGFILQRLRGDGMVFMHAGETVVERRLNNETLRVDTGCLVGSTPAVAYDIQRAGNLKSMFFGGKGCSWPHSRARGQSGFRVCHFPGLPIASLPVPRGWAGPRREKARCSADRPNARRRQMTTAKTHGALGGSASAEES